MISEQAAARRGFGNPLGISPAMERELAQEALRVGERVDERFTMVTGGVGSLAGDLGGLVDFRVWCEERGFESAVAHQDYAAWEDTMIFCTLVDDEGPAATVRLIYSHRADHLTKTELELGFEPGELRDRLGLTALVDLPSLVVMPRVRATTAVGLLLGEATRRTLDLPKIAMHDVRFYRVLVRWGAEVEPLLDLAPVDYLGVDFQPTFVQAGPQLGFNASGSRATLTAAVRSRIDLGPPEDMIDVTMPIEATERT